MLKPPPCSQSGKLSVISDHCALLTDKLKHITYFVIRCKFFFLFIGWKPTTWPANNCLQIMVCSWTMSSNCVWLQIILCSCVNETTRDTFLREKGRSLRFPKIFVKKQTWWSNDKTISELGYHKISWFASVSYINYLPQPSASRQIIDLLANNC